MKPRTNGSNGRSAPVKPIHRITRGKVEATLWKRQGRGGDFFQVSFSRPYQTKDGSFGSSENFGGTNVADLVTVAIEAMLWMEAQRQPRIRNGGDSHEGPEAEFDQDGDAADYEQF